MQIGVENEIDNLFKVGVSFMASQANPRFKLRLALLSFSKFLYEIIFKNYHAIYVLRIHREEH